MLDQNDYEAYLQIYFIFLKLEAAHEVTLDFPEGVIRRVTFNVR
jgi:hypothetical protein